MIRAIALVKQGNLEFKRILHPRMVRPLIIGNKVIDKQIIFSVMAFLMLYTVIALISTIVFLLSGLDGLTSFSAALACLNNLGPALGSLGPSYNFTSLSDFQVFILLLPNGYRPSGAVYRPRSLYPRILESLNIKKGPGKQKGRCCAVLF